MIVLDCGFLSAWLSGELLVPRGNPQARNLLEVITHLQKSGSLRLQLALKRG